MPSAPKHTERREADFYETPEWCTQALMLDYPLDEHTFVVEPCAGSGAISKVIKLHYPHIKLTQYEIRAEEKKNLMPYGKTKICNFLSLRKRYYGVNFVITNPPFFLAQEFINKSLYLYPNAEVVMLLPFSFLGSKKRHAWWKKTPLNQIKILSKRPSFTNNGKTDSSIYGWFVFRSHNKQGITPFIFL